MSNIHTELQEQAKRLNAEYTRLDRSSKRWLVAGVLGLAAQTFLIVKIAKTDSPK